MKILLVEDDNALATALCELLSRQGYCPIRADCASAAEEKITQCPDLVLMDVNLPDGDGVALCQRWRSRGITTPILFSHRKCSAWS